MEENLQQSNVAQPELTPQAIVPPIQPHVDQPILPPKKSNKFVSIIVILVVIFILIFKGIGIYTKLNQKITQNQITSVPKAPLPLAMNPTIDQSTPSNWKTYTNKQFGYTLQFPTSLDENEDRRTVHFTKHQSQPGIGYPDTLYISVIPDNSIGDAGDVYNYWSPQVIDTFISLPVGKSYATQKEECSIPCFTYKRLPNIMVDSYTGAVVEVPNAWEIGKADRRILIKKDTNIFMFGGYYSTQDELNTFNQMIATFKFTDQNQATNSNGTVNGKLCYPSEGIPAGKIIAKSLTTGKLYSQDYLGTSKGGGTTYSFSLPPDTYHMKLDVTRDPNNPYAGYYDAYSHCITANDPNNPVCSGNQAVDSLPVAVIKGSTTSNIDLCDFYNVGNHTPQY